MRNVVVLPQPDGPSRVVKLPCGISSETSSTAGAVAFSNRLLSATSRTCASGIGQLVQPHAPAADRPEHNQDRDGARDHGHREGGRTAPVEVIHELEDGDGGDGGARGKE